MADDFPSSDKMMTNSAAKKPFHFSGDGVYHNLTIWAEDIEQATVEYLARRVLIGSEQSPTPKKRDTEAEVQ